MKVEFYINRKIYNNKNYYIFAASPINEKENLKLNKYGNVSLCGDLSYLIEGKNYTLDIEEDKETQYGMLYRVLPMKFSSDMKLTQEQQMQILCSITTEKQAQYIYDAYPNFVQMVLDGKEDEIDVSKIYNVKIAKKEIYIREIRDKYQCYVLMSELDEWGLTFEDCQALLFFSSDVSFIKNQLKENPYHILIDICEKYFEASDEKILNIYPEFEMSDVRIEYLMLDILDSNEIEKSNSYMDANTMALYTNDYDPKTTPLLKEVAIKSDLIWYDDSTKRIAKQETYNKEKLIYDFIIEKLNEKPSYIWEDIYYKDYVKLNDIKLTETQQMPLKNLCEHKISMLIGYSGTGKTTTLKALINLVEEVGMSYEILCPTGKAAQRVYEVTKRKAYTIHKKCGNGTSSITCDVVFIDECSMINLDTFVMFLNAIENPDIHIVLIGDNAQLLPIGIGNIFNDFINSNTVPYTMLTEIFRYTEDGQIFVATNIREGKKFLNSNEKIQNFGENYKFIKSNDYTETIIETYKSLLNQNIKPDDILCISPYNIGEYGTYKINSLLQEIVNPRKNNENKFTYKRDKYTITINIGDIILNKKNNYKVLGYDEYLQTGIITEPEIPKAIFNGQIGKVRDIDEYQNMIVQFDEELLIFPPKIAKNFLLGYCITAHSSQGSQAQYVINLTIPEHSRMLNKNLCYVASTRSENKHYEIGTPNALHDALSIDGNTDRKTLLINMFKGE